MQEYLWDGMDAGKHKTMEPRELWMGIAGAALSVATVTNRLFPIALSFSHKPFVLKTMASFVPA